MTWQSLKIEADEATAETLSDVLLELGALSVSLEDAQAGTDQEQPIFGEPGMPPADLWQRSVVSALFPPEADIAALVLQAGQSVNLQSNLRYTVEQVPEQDWVRLTQAQFEPIQISPRLWITPTWHSTPDPDAINLILDPGLAFGTGSHPTTRLCLQWLDQCLHNGESVLDYGCGSGVLAIAAMKLGAGQVTGVDIDPQAIQASRSNAEQNQVTAQFSLPDAAQQIEADVVVANILTNPLKVLAPILAQAARPGGRIVLSGILAEQAQAVRDVYERWFDMSEFGVDEGWACLTGTKRVSR
jgi:ribosomal protein L11 methyltransferase